MTVPIRVAFYLPYSLNFLQECYKTLCHSSRWSKGKKLVRCYPDAMTESSVWNSWIQWSPFLVGI
uniref:Uncharacterized protein n=1 Tax=Arundo donax TaxID=35708 RepID=A0A0A9BKC3_ARUDO